MWKMYDELIEGIPSDLIIEDVNISMDLALVSTKDSTGVGYVYQVRSLSPGYSKDWRGEKLKDLASCVKSWYLPEAALGAAAINCWYNSKEMCEKNGIDLGDMTNKDVKKSNPFNVYQEAVKDKKVAVIDHFPYLEKLIAPYCDLKILDDKLGEGDYPTYAAEYILPECDYVFISCGTFVKKTLPRYLELSKNAYTIIVGPMTPMTPKLFEYGVQDLSGFIVRDKELAYRINSGGSFGSLYRSGKKVHFTKEMMK